LAAPCCIASFSYWLLLAFCVGVDQERNFTEPVEEPFIKGPLFVCYAKRRGSSKLGPNEPRLFLLPIAFLNNQQF
jgi:hypothetical protein